MNERSLNFSGKRCSPIGIAASLVHMHLIPHTVFLWSNMWAPRRASAQASWLLAPCVAYRTHILCGVGAFAWTVCCELATTSKIYLHLYAARAAALRARRGSPGRWPVRSGRGGARTRVRDRVTRTRVSRLSFFFTSASCATMILTQAPRAHLVIVVRFHFGLPHSLHTASETDTRHDNT